MMYQYKFLHSVTISDSPISDRGEIKFTVNLNLDLGCGTMIDETIFV